MKRTESGIRGDIKGEAVPTGMLRPGAGESQPPIIGVDTSATRFRRRARSVPAGEPTRRPVDPIRPSPTTTDNPSVYEPIRNRRGTPTDASEKIASVEVHKPEAKGGTGGGTDIPPIEPPRGRGAAMADEPDEPRDTARMQEFQSTSATTALPRRTEVSDSQREGSKIPRERLTDQEVDNLLGGLLNHEAKLIVLGQMALQPRWYTNDDLLASIRDSQRGHDGWNPSTLVYCRDSFTPIALVSKDETRGDALAYRVTPAGEDALGVIGHLLEFAEDTDVSIQKIFSTSGSSSPKGNGEGQNGRKRAPITRYKLFQAVLATEGPLREIDVRRQIGEQNNIRLHLQNLDKHGVLGYTSEQAGGQSIVSYTKVSEKFADPDSVPRQSDPKRSMLFTQRVVTTISHMDGAITIPSLTDAFLAEFPQHAGAKRPNVEGDISRVLNHLARHGYLERNEFEGRRKLSDISLTDKQRGRMQRLVDIIKQYQEGDPEFLKQGRNKARVILRDPARVATLMKKAEENSVVVGALGPAALKEKILDLINGSEGPLCGPVVSRLLNNRIGPGYSAQLLRELHDAGDIVVSKRDNAVWYEPAGGRVAVDALPDDKVGLEAARAEVSQHLLQFTSGLKLLTAAYGGHDPESDEAREIMEHMQSVRRNPEYIRLLRKSSIIAERLDAFDEPGDTSGW